MTAPNDQHGIFRSGPEECSYLRKRAADHLLLAARSAEPGPRETHLRLARLYGDRVRLLSLVRPD